MVDYEARRAPELLWTAQWPAGQMWTEGEEQRLSLFFKSNFKSCEGARPNSEFLFFNYLKVRVQALFPKNGCHFLANNIWKWWDTVIRKLWTSLYCCDQTPQHFSEGGNSLRIAKYLPKGDWTNFGHHNPITFRSVHQLSPCSPQSIRWINNNPHFSLHPAVFPFLKFGPTTIKKSTAGCPRPFSTGHGSRLSLVVGIKILKKYCLLSCFSLEINSSLKIIRSKDSANGPLLCSASLSHPGNLKAGSAACAASPSTCSSLRPLTALMFLGSTCLLSRIRDPRRFPMLLKI